MTVRATKGSLRLSRPAVKIQAPASTKEINLPQAGERRQAQPIQRVQRTTKRAQPQRQRATSPQACKSIPKKIKAKGERTMAAPVKPERAQVGLETEEAYIEGQGGG